jgi:hypothetical protein
MKKKIVVSVCCLVVAIAGVVMGEMFSHVENSESMLFLENVEALSQDEFTPECSVNAICKIGSDVWGSVSCRGKESCESGYGYVICDGLKSICTYSVAPDQRKNS